MPDERDLGNRPIVNAQLVPEMDKLDERAREVAASVAAQDRAARQAVAAKAPGLARELFQECADAWRAAFGGHHHRVAEYEKHVADCKSLIALQKRGRK